MTCFSMQTGIALLLIIGGAIGLVVLAGIILAVIWIVKKLGTVFEDTIVWVIIGMIACLAGYGFWLAAGGVMREYFHVCVGG